MTGFEPRTYGMGSDRSANWTTPLPSLTILPFESSLLFDLGNYSIGLGTLLFFPLIRQRDGKPTAVTLHYWFSIGGPKNRSHLCQPGKLEYSSSKICLAFNWTGRSLAKTRRKLEHSFCNKVLSYLLKRAILTWNCDVGKVKYFLSNIIN